MENNNFSRFQITELFMAKAGLGMKGFDRCFYGTIREERTKNGILIYHGKILVKNNIHNSTIYAKSTNRNELSDMLDSLVVMILDKGLHDNDGKFFKKDDFKYYMN